MGATKRNFVERWLLCPKAKLFGTVAIRTNKKGRLMSPFFVILLFFLLFAVGIAPRVVEEELYAPAFFVEIAIAKTIGSHIEGLVDEVANLGIRVKIVLLLHYSEVGSIHHNELAIDSGHNIVTLTSLSVSLVGFLNCLTIAEVLEKSSK